MDTSDFSDFYTTSFPRVVTAVRAFSGDSDLAREATQEAFARAYARWGRVREAAWPQAWVTTTAMNIVRRSHRRRPAPAKDPLPAEAPTSDRLDVLSALRALPERQRQAVVLHYLMDLSVTAVADVMGVSDGAIKAHLHRARAALRDALEVRHA